MRDHDWGGGRQLHRLLLECDSQPISSIVWNGLILSKLSPDGGIRDELSSDDKFDKLKVCIGLLVLQTNAMRKHHTSGPGR